MAQRGPTTASRTATTTSASTNGQGTAYATPERIGCHMGGSTETESLLVDVAADPTSSSSTGTRAETPLTGQQQEQRTPLSSRLLTVSIFQQPRLLLRRFIPPKD